MERGGKLKVERLKGKPCNCVKRPDSPALRVTQARQLHARRAFDCIKFGAVYPLAVDGKAGVFGARFAARGGFGKVKRPKRRAGRVLRVHTGENRAKG